MDKIFLPFDKMWFFALFCPIFVITDGNLAQKSIFAIQALFLIDSIWIFEKKFFLSEIVIWPIWPKFGLNLARVGRVWCFSYLLALAIPSMRSKKFSKILLEIRLVFLCHKVFCNSKN